MASMSPLTIRSLGQADYEQIWHAMQSFTLSRDTQTADELWLTAHEPVYTLGLNRRDVRMPARQDIPLVMVDRGGKITYHGPGQVVVYLLIDLKRRGWSVRQLVNAMENAIIDLLAAYNIRAIARADAPGVYVDGRKIASLGLRLKNGCSYHGLALNVDMDLAPFEAIDPCGYQGLQVTQLRDLGVLSTQQEVAEQLLMHLQQQLHQTEILAETA
jgi:lipoyl(octanoyl) transferase